MTPLQKQTAQAIVNIFETGTVAGDYGKVTIMRGDPGHLTYGRAQTTLAGGNLALLLHAYCAADGRLSSALAPYLPAFDRQDLSLDANEDVKALLQQAGTDPVMQKAQDGFFDRVYWAPAAALVAALQITTPLGATVVYDSMVHGSFRRIRDKVIAARGPCNSQTERPWVEDYVNTRRHWLETHTNPLLHRTVYRMDTFLDLIRTGKWTLDLPLKVRGLTVSQETLSAAAPPPLIASAAGVEERILMLTAPMMQSPDIKRLQRLLGMPVSQQDGLFGSITDAAVRDFQATHGLVVDGRVGKATWAALETNPPPGLQNQPP